MGRLNAEEICPACGQKMGYASWNERDYFQDNAGRYWHDYCAAVALSGLFVAPPAAQTTELPLVWQEV